VNAGEPALVGVDGGASGLRAARVVRGAAGWFDLAGPVLAVACDRAHGARDWIEAAADLAVRVSGTASLVLGIGMPGRKTADGRGIASALHGPVEERFCDLVEERLAALGARLVRPIARLHDDGLLGASGEAFGVRGVLRGVRCAYAIGGGTGLAEAFVIDGRPVVFEEAGGALVRAYALPCRGSSFEERLSVRGLNAAHRDAGGSGAVEDALGAGDVRAERLFAALADDLMALVHAREHALRRTFERIAISQRLARLLAAPAARALLADHALAQRCVLADEPASNVIGAAALAAALDADRPARSCDPAGDLP
jgi:hypothetical protein